MRYFEPSSIVPVLLVLLLSGCRLPGSGGPVPKALAKCRELSQQGIAAAERSQHEEAEALLAKAVEACPVDPEARRHYAEALWHRGSRQKAVAELEEASRLVSEDATLLVRLAEMHLAMGHLRLAQQSAERALDLDPKFSAAWAIRGRVSRASGQLEQALADYHRSLGYGPGQQQVLLEMAELYRQLNRPQRALATLQSLADTYSPGEEPQHLLYLTGLAYMALGRYDAGAESFAAAASRGKPTAEILYRLAEAELAAGRWNEAAAAARHALALQPKHQPCRMLLDRVEMARQPQAPPRR